MPPRIDFTSQRLYLDQPMSLEVELLLDKAQANYLLNVLRMKEGATILVFNGVDGEWLATLCEVNKKSAKLKLITQTRSQTKPGNIWLCFAPIKSGRLEYMVQKAVEMGASKLIPIITNRTQGGRGLNAKLNIDRMRAHVIEAAEQCGILSLPEVSEDIKLLEFLTLLESSQESLKETSRTIIFCDEAAEVTDPLQTLQSIPRNAPIAVLIGPEGGFDDTERKEILTRGTAIPIALGPRILRADTAAVAAMAVIQIASGDWK